MSLINVSSLTFGYEGSFENVFENASFSIDTDWKLGFIGRNGRGKTTFLNLLMGKYEYTGSISATVSFEYFPYEVRDPDMNPLEIAEEYLSDFQQWRLNREISLLDMEDGVLYRPFYTLSNGEQTKILLAIMFLKENAFMLIDEPTNHLDSRARDILAKYLRSKKGFILVSHDRVFVDETVDHVLSINRANIQVIRGNFSTWKEQKELEDRFELEQNDKLKKDVRRLDAAAKRTEKWSAVSESNKIGFDPAKKEKSMGMRSYEGEKSRKMMKRAKNIETRRNSALEEKTALLKNIESNDTELKLNILKHPKKLLIECTDLGISYDGQQVFSGLNLSIFAGDRCALKGKNGCGKSSLIKLLLGESIDYSGQINLASNLKISYVPQSTAGMGGDLSDYAEANGIDKSLFLAILRKLDFQRSQFDKRIETFSEGQKKKVLIAGSLCEAAHIFIWDEPLNYIDVISRMQIEELLIKSNATILFVEHDRAFNNVIATKNIDFDAL